MLARTLQSRFYIPKFVLVPPRDWVGSLAKLVVHLRRDDIRSVDALLAFISRDYVTSRMLYHLLRWLPMAKRADGLVYKSAADWQAETGISEGQIKTRKANGALAEVGIAWDVMRANKIPHSHYGLDADVFVQRLAAALGLMVCQVEAICYLREMPGSGADQPGGMDESPHSLTEQHSKTQLGVNDVLSSAGKILSIDEMVVDKLVRAGLTRKDNPERFLVLPQAVIDQCIQDTEAAKRAGEIRYTVRAYLRGALENQVKKMQESPPAVQYDAGMTGHAPTDEREVCGVCGEKPHWFTGECGCAEKPLSETCPAAAQGEEITSDKTGMTGHAPTEAGSPQNVGEEDAWVWGAAYNQLELQMDRQSFDLLRGAKLVGVDGGVFVVRVESDYARQMLQHRLYRTVQRVMRDCRGEQTDVRFEVM